MSRDTRDWKSEQSGCHGRHTEMLAENEQWLQNAKENDLLPKIRHSAKASNECKCMMKTSSGGSKSFSPTHPH